jgi:hypothetical protein
LVGKLMERDCRRRLVLSVGCQIAQLSPRDLSQGISGAERGKANRRVGRERRRNSPVSARLEKQVAELMIAAFSAVSPDKSQSVAIVLTATPAD